MEHQFATGECFLFHAKLQTPSKPSVQVHIHFAIYIRRYENYWNETFENFKNIIIMESLGRMIAFERPRQ